MKSDALEVLTVRALLVMVVAAGSLVWPPAQAQQVYRIVGSDGKVTFSDRAPPTGNASAGPSSAGAAGASVSAGLPFELRQVASRYPVTLYTSNNCAPCLSARSMLTSRGVPFSEKTVTTVEDTQALQRISGDNSLPFLTIGSQQLKGFSDAEWTQYLNAAGYPPSLVLPASYRAPGVTPLVVLATAPAATPASGSTAAISPPAARPTRQAPQPGANPSGIKF